MIFEAVEVGQLQVNCYILAESGYAEAVIIDPGDDEEKIRRALAKHNLKAGLIINTHGHIDHIGCDDNFGVSVYIHRLDADLLKDPALNFSVFLNSAYTLDKKTKVNLLEDKSIIKLGKIELEVIHTPGHTPGGICLLLKSPQNKILFSGDTLFYRSVGRTDFPGADGRLLINSIKNKLLQLSGDTIIYPGHGPSSSIEEEKKHNHFIR